MPTTAALLADPTSWRSGGVRARRIGWTCPTGDIVVADVVVDPDGWSIR